MLVTNPRHAEINQHGTYARMTCLEKSAHDICLELKHETCLMLYGEISTEQFRAKRNVLIKAFQELGLPKFSNEKSLNEFEY